MNLTSRSRYALKIMLDLAKSRPELLVRRQEIVDRQGIPAKYLDQILIKLRRDGLVESVRGCTGGYRLSRNAQSISVWEIFRAVEDGIYPVECVDELQGCEFMSRCEANQPWQIIFHQLRQTLTQMKLADFERSWPAATGVVPAQGFRECRPGREPLRVATLSPMSVNFENGASIHD